MSTSRHSQTPTHPPCPVPSNSPHPFSDPGGDGDHLAIAGPAPLSSRRMRSYFCFRSERGVSFQVLTRTSGLLLRYHAPS